MLDHARHCRCIQRPHLRAPGQCGDQARQQLVILVVPVELIAEIGLDLEQARKIRIVV